MWKTEQGGAGARIRQGRYENGIRKTAPYMLILKKNHKIQIQTCFFFSFLINILRNFCVSLIFIKKKKALSVELYYKHRYAHIQVLNLGPKPCEENHNWFSLLTSKTSKVRNNINNNNKKKTQAAKIFFSVPMIKKFHNNTIVIKNQVGLLTIQVQVVWQGSLEKQDSIHTFIRTSSSVVFNFFLTISENVQLQLAT